MTVSLCPPVEHVVCAVSWSTKAAFLCRTVKIWAASVRLNLKCHLWSHSGILASYAQQFCGRPPLQENRIVGGVDATDGSWPWQVDIQVGPSGTATILCACSRLHVRFSVVYQTDPLREGFACDAEVTHSFFFSPRLPDKHWWSYLWRLHHHRELGPVSRSLFRQVRKISSHWKIIRWIFHLSANPQVPSFSYEPSE